MNFLDKLLSAEKKIQTRIDRAFGKGAAQTPLEMRRAILQEVEDRIVIRSGKRIFPFNRVAVHLVAPEGDLRDLLNAAFVEEKSLEKDIRDLLRDTRCELPLQFIAVADFVDDENAGSGRYRLEFLRTEERAAAERSQPAIIQFTVLKGAAEQPVYQFHRERIQIGRLHEVLDKEGQVVRRNDVVFLDNGDDINATVGRAHATVYFSTEKNEYRIIDEASRYGTRIFREGRSIEVPGGNPRGIRLVPGDELYLGHASLRFGFGGGADDDCDTYNCRGR